VITSHARWTIAAVSLTAATAAVQAVPVCHVDDDAVPGGDGTSWTTAFRFLRDAVTCASDPESGILEIRVAGGVYVPDRDETIPVGTGNRQASFELVDDVVVRGGYLGLAAGAGESPDERDLLLHASTLSGDLNGDDGPGPVGNDENSYHVVTASAGAGIPTLDGFTITAGNANGSTPRDRGGGLYVDGGNPRILDCTFDANLAGGLNGRGGAVYLLVGDPLFADCTFLGNVAGAEGGAMYVAATSRPTVANCAFESNVAVSRGGAMRNTASDPTVVNCTFLGNTAVEGGGMHNTGPSAPVVTGCVFLGNSADSHGGGMFNTAAANAHVVNCTFTANVAGCDGGGMLNFNCDTTVSNCEFTNNHAAQGGAMVNRLGSPMLDGCTFDNNTAGTGGGLYNLGASRPIVRHCAFSGNIAEGGRGGGMHNQSCSPELIGCLFVDNWAADGGAMSNDQASSPQIAGCSFIANTAEQLGGAVFSRYGGVPLVTSSAFTSNTAGSAGGALASVLFAEPSVWDSLLCGNEPNQVEGAWMDGGGNDVDETCVETCPADLTRDGLVDITDVLVVLVEWGPCAGGCLGDVDADGMVGITDLLKVLGAWGPCPGMMQGPGMPGGPLRKAVRPAFR
jgi:hypothetical protein